MNLKFTKKVLFSIYLIFAIATSGFVGLLLFYDLFDTNTSNVSAATTWYVGGSGPGNESTISTAITKASDGDVIRVYDGMYTENLVIDKQVSIIGNGSLFTSIYGSSSNDVIEVTSDWVNLTGFSIWKSGTSGAPDFDSGLRISYAENVWVYDNWFFDNNVGIQLDNSDSNIIENNKFFSNSLTSIFLYYSHANDIIDNICKNNGLNGIELDNSDANKVVNNTCIFNNGSGIILYQAHLNEIEDNICQNNSRNGIASQSSNNNFNKNNKCIFNNWSGMMHADSDSNDIINCSNNYNNISGIELFLSDSNTLFENSNNYNNRFGTIIHTSDQNKVLNSTYNYNVFDSIWVQTSNLNLIANNTCNSLNIAGIYLNFSTATNLSNNSLNICGIVIDGNQPKYWDTHDIDSLNTVNNRPIYYWKSRANNLTPTDAGQVVLANCTNITIINQNIQNNLFAIGVAYSNSINVTENSLSNNVYGLLVYSSNQIYIRDDDFSSNIMSGARLVYGSGCVVDNTSLHDNDYNGLDLFYSDNNTVANCSFSNNNNDGLYLYYSDGNLVQYNNVSENSLKGIHLYRSNKNYISNNELISNQEHGIYIQYSDNNHVYHNNLITNVIQAFQLPGSINNWDNGHEEGNYWSDYTGLDDGSGGRSAGDGIGDTNIKHSNLDNYPFINRSGWLYPGVPRLLPPVIDSNGFDSDGNYTIGWLKNRGTVKIILEEDIYSDFRASNIVYDGLGLDYQVINKANGTYYYRLTAVSDANESARSSIKSVTVDWKPDVPKNFQVSVWPFGNALYLSWDINQMDTTKYIIEYKSKTTIDWEYLKTIQHPNNTFNHTGLQDDDIYFYRLLARDGRNQDSKFTKVISATPEDTVAPNPPTGLNIIQVGYDSIEIAWKPNTEDDVVGYHIYISNITNPTNPYNLIGTVFVKDGSLEFNHTSLDELTTYHYTIKAFDEVPNNSSFSEVIIGKTILGPHKPEINIAMANFSIEEDSIDNTTIDLYRWFKDVNIDDTLEFWAEGFENINVTIHENGKVTIKPKSDWHGKEIIKFFASDGMFNVSDDVIITVTSVNDPPRNVTIVSPNDGIEIIEGETLTFEGEAFNADLANNDTLSYTWHSSISKDFGNSRILTDYKLPPGNHKITLIVTDNKGVNATATININVKKAKESEDSETSNLLFISAIGVIIVILLIIILFIFSRKRKDTDKEKEVGVTYDEPLTTDQLATPTTPEQVAPGPVDISEQMLQEQVPIIAPVEPVTLETAEQVQPVAQVTQATIEEGAVTAAEPPTVSYEIDPVDLVEAGRAYIIITKGSEFGLGIFKKLIFRFSGKGIFITRTHPSEFEHSYNLEGVTQIWLSKTPGPISISPGNVTKIAHIISEYLKENEGSVILLDGVEYLINNNDFPRTLKFIEMIHERIVLNKGVLIVPINPLALTKSDYELLEMELVNKIKDPEFSNEILQ